MHPKRLLILATIALVLSLLSGCGSASGVRVTKGDQQVGAAPKGSTFVTRDATIVHVNENDRLATLRNAHSFAAGTFLIARDRDGEQSAVLKARANRASGLRTADILEGMPTINDRATPASSAESSRLGKIYPEVVEE
jgi:hypothetical protein